MATLNELIAQLNASSDNILSDASRLNTAADSMNQTLNGIGVQEVSGIEQLVPDEKQNIDSSYVLPQDLGTNVPPQGILSQIKDAAMNYIQSGGMIGIGANILGGLLPDMDPRQQALKDFYGYDSTGSVPQGQLMAGYNPVSGGLFSPTTYGLQNAYQKRMDTINRTLARKYADGDYTNTLLDERLIDLRNLRDAEQKFVADQLGQTYTRDQDTQNVIDNTGRRDATGGDPGSRGASDQFSNRSGRGRTGY
jgi:hypothetical protein